MDFITIYLLSFYFIEIVEKRNFWCTEFQTEIDLIYPLIATHV